MNQITKSISSGLSESLVYHAADPLEVLQIIKNQRIPAANELTEDNSFCLYPRVYDGVTLMKPADVREYFRRGFLFVFNKNDLPGYFETHPHLYNNNSIIQVGGVRGSIEFSQITPELLINLTPDFRLEHPMFTAQDLHHYAMLRVINAKKQLGIDLPAVTADFNEFDCNAYFTESGFGIAEMFTKLNVSKLSPNLSYVIQYKA